MTQKDPLRGVATRLVTRSQRYAFRREHCAQRTLSGLDLAHANSAESRDDCGRIRPRWNVQPPVIRKGRYGHRSAPLAWDGRNDTVKIGTLRRCTIAMCNEPEVGRSIATDRRPFSVAQVIASVVVKVKSPGYPRSGDTNTPRMARSARRVLRFMRAGTGN